MGCYTVPATAAIIHFFLRRNSKALYNDKYHTWLNHLFLGGAIFGVVDHIWNRQLMRFTISDILLGFGITLSIVVVWAVMVTIDINKTQNKAELSA